jgi:hypothetical protein
MLITNRTARPMNTTAKTQPQHPGNAWDKSSARKRPWFTAKLLIATSSLIAPLTSRLLLSKVDRTAHQRTDATPRSSTIHREKILTPGQPECAGTGKSSSKLRQALDCLWKKVNRPTRSMAAARRAAKNHRNSSEESSTIPCANQRSIIAEIWSLCSMSSRAQRWNADSLPIVRSSGYDQRIGSR